MVADLRFAEQLQVRQRVEVDPRVHLAEHAERLAVGRDDQAVRRRALQPFGHLLGGRHFRQRDLVDDLVRGEIDGDEAVEVRELHEDPLGRSVGVGVERHRPHAVCGRHRPRRSPRSSDRSRGPSCPGIEPATTNLPSGVT